MLSLARKSSRRADHEHDFVTHHVGADLQRRVCGNCGHISISNAQPSNIPAVIVEKSRLFGVNPEFVYRLARTLDAMPAVDPSRPRFGERRTERRR